MTLTAEQLEILYPQIGEKSKDVEVIDLKNLKGYDKVDNHAFRNYWYVKKIYLPRTIKVIGKAAFLPDGLFEATDEVKLETVFMGNQIEKICDGAFYKCKNLQMSYLPEKLKYIGRSAFMDCSMLNIRSLPDSLETICPTAFMNCKNIRQISFGSNLTYVGTEAFMNCINLERINMHDVNKRLCISIHGAFNNTRIRNTAFLKEYIDNYIDMRIAAIRMSE